MNSHFKEITITNFRGFDSLTIKKLQRINIFVGANNVGKNINTGSRIHVERHVESFYIQSHKLSQNGIA